MNATARPSPMPPAHELVSRRALLTIGVTLASVLAGVALVQLTGHGPKRREGQVLSTRALRFEDLPDGGILVLDHASGQRLAVMTGEQGFLRGVLRSLMRERRRSGRDLRAPLELMARPEGRLTLADPSTGQRIELESFGPSNLAVFAPWVAAPAVDPSHRGEVSR